MTPQALDLPPKSAALRLAAAIVVVWSGVALLLATQGYLTSGRQQAWWPSLGYSFAIFSVWAVLTAPILAAVRRIEGSRWSLAQRMAAYGAGVVVVCALHVGLFALAWWPVYNDGGRIPTRWAMGERMFVRNFGTSAVLYAAIIVVGLLAAGRERRAVPVVPDVLRARSRGATRIVPLDHVEWIQAAGNYAEAHTAGGAVLLDEPLASLAARLPADRFARIHRRAIVRLDRITEVRSLGRGDAEVRLRSGQGLRLSRRYRDALSALLNGR
jgi:two-component system LytT family response regulator